MSNEIKNCGWECSEEFDGECLINKCWTGKCNCKECGCFFQCSNCKKGINGECLQQEVE